MHEARRGGRHRAEPVAWRRCAAALATGMSLGMAAISQGADADGAAAEPPRFRAADIAIGEPVALPASPPLPPPPAATQLPPAVPAAATPAASIPGNGWLGLVVAESSTPGRFVIAEVAEGGPASAAGIRAGDEVRGIEGLPIRSSDEVAQALTAIAPGQKVRLAIARGEQVGDLTLEAVPRPAAARGWAAAAAAPPERLPSPPAFAQAPPAFAQAPPAVAAAAPAFAPPPSVVSPVDSGRDPPRFSPPAADAPPFARAPAAVDPPSAPILTSATRGRTALGVRTVPIDAATQARFRLPEASGAYVVGVVGDLPASKAGVPPGSVIVAIDNRPVRTPEELTKLVTAGPVGKPVPLEFLLPGGTPRRADVVLQTLEQPLEAALVGDVEPQPTDVPSLQPRPAGTTARRPVAPGDRTSSAALRDEVDRLRARVESLERRLAAATAGQAAAREATARP